jgi:two-component system, cell cycle sensor histidine kinase and response regulator CckA
VSDQGFPTRDASTAAGASAKFTVIEGRAKGRRFKVDQSATVGRSSEATIMLEDPEVSRMHARVARTSSGRFEITDLNSRNGTFVNGQRVASRLLDYGDKIRVGPNAMLEYYGFDATEEQIIQRERFEAIGRLTIGIAHDLNNVLAALDAGTSYLRELPRNESLDTADVRECLADMSLASVRAAELTRAVLSFVRGSGHDHQPVDVSSLVLEITRMLRYTLDRSIALRPGIAPRIFVHGNRSELHQALLNLCLNARDAMPHGGVLTLRVELQPGPHQQTGWNSEQPAVIVTVRDTGVGMDAATQARIFEPFFTTKSDGRGYGLGLATVREIATIHGGQISVQSLLGKGTQFSLILPALLEHEQELSETASRGPSVTLRPPATYSILLVDDEEIVRRSMARCMRQTGFEVIEAASGFEALRLYQEHHVDLVLLDIDMPELDGEQTYEELRKLDLHARVAFMSGYSDPVRAARLKSRGALAMFEKPCSLDALLGLAQANASRPTDAPAEDDFESLTRPV